MPDAVQRVYAAGVPPIQGTERLFPIGIYHGLSGEFFGRTYSLAPLAAAGFNTVHLWRGQPLEPALAEARALGLRVLWETPTDAEAANHAGDPTVLGWILDEEATTRIDPDDMDKVLGAFRTRQSQLRRSDPVHPSLAVEASPPRNPARAVAWRKWLREGDVSCHFNYPVRTGGWGLDTLDTPRGIPKSVAEAVEVNDGKRPMWLIVQAFSAPKYRWSWPNPAQLNAMTWAGLIHGATGLIFFSQDSFVTRDGDVVGITPDPVADFGEIPDFDHSGSPPLVADAEDMANARLLWGRTLNLVAWLRRIEPDLLAPTADFPYGVAVDGIANSANPVRTLLKDGPEGLLLLAVNLDDARLRMRLTPGRAVGAVEAVVGPAPLPSDEMAGSWEAELEPFAIRAWRLRPVPPH